MTRRDHSDHRSGHAFSGIWQRGKSGCTAVSVVPLNERYTNTVPKVDITVFRNVFGLSVYVKDFAQENTDKCPMTLSGVIRYVRDEYGMRVSKSSVCAVRDKCGADVIALGAARVVPELNTEKERAVYEAFKVFTEIMGAAPIAQSGAVVIGA